MQKSLAKWHKIKWYTAFKPIYSWLVFRGMQLQRTQQLAMTLHWPCAWEKATHWNICMYVVCTIEYRIHSRCDLFRPPPACAIENQGKLHASFNTLYAVWKELYEYYKYFYCIFLLFKYGNYKISVLGFFYVEYKSVYSTLQGIC